MIIFCLISEPSRILDSMMPKLVINELQRLSHDDALLLVLSRLSGFFRE